MYSCLNLVVKKHLLLTTPLNRTQSSLGDQWKLWVSQSHSTLYVLVACSPRDKASLKTWHDIDIFGERPFICELSLRADI